MACVALVRDRAVDQIDRTPATAEPEAPEEADMLPVGRDFAANSPERPIFGSVLTLNRGEQRLAGD
jgi:hypothetical protein